MFGPDELQVSKTTTDGQGFPSQIFTDKQRETVEEMSGVRGQNRPNDHYTHIHTVCIYRLSQLFLLQQATYVKPCSLCKNNTFWQPFRRWTDDSQQAVTIVTTIAAGQCSSLKLRWCLFLFGTTQTDCGRRTELGYDPTLTAEHRSTALAAWPANTNN